MSMHPFAPLPQVSTAGHEAFPEFICRAACIHQAFELQACKTPGAIALKAPSPSSSLLGNNTLTYAQLNQKANHLAHYLIRLGIGPDSLVAVSLPRSLEMVIAMLGVLKAGGAYVPIDPAYPASRRAYILQDALKGSSSPVLLTHSSLAPTLTVDLAADLADSPTSGAALPGPNLTVLSIDTDWHTILQSNDAVEVPNAQENPTVAVTAQNLAYVIYTSGSTGNPKGVMVKHQGVMNHAAAMAGAFEMSPADRMLQFSSISFDIIVEELYPTLITGATLVLRPEEIATSLTAFLQFTAAENITILDLPTAFWHELVSGLERMAVQGTGQLAPSIRLVIVGGEKASRAIYDQWYGMVGDYPRWINTYGPTETTVTATLYDPVAEGFDLSKELPIGKAITHVETYVLTANDTASVKAQVSTPQASPLRSVSPGESGELYIGGPGLARGYLDLPEKTAAAFVAHPFSPGERLYKTGDIVRQLPDGNLEFVGRADFQVKLRGFRIELGEIENCLEKHPDVQQQIVVAREDVVGEKRLVAYVVTAEQRPLEVSKLKSELQAFMRENLPSYMVPSAFVWLPALPITPNGKVDRKALPAPTVSAKQQEEVVAPQTPLEAKLVEIWQRVLGVQPVGTTDNFFDLGGHSLLVMRLFNEMETQWACSLPVTAILEAPTVGQLAAVLEAALTAELGADATTDDPVSAKGSKRLGSSLVLLKTGFTEPPLFLVHDADGDTGLYIHLARQLSGDRAVYGLKPLTQPGMPMVHSRIPDMAAHYIAEIRRRQPHGPYLLGGLCAGGVLAAEMTLQLEAVGETVALTALLEAPDVAAEERASFYEQRLTSLSQALANLSVAQRVQTLTKKAVNLVRYDVGLRWQNINTSLKIRTLRHWQTRQPAHKLTPPKFLQGLPVRTLYLFAEQSYLPEAKMHGNVILIKAAHDSGEQGDQPYREYYQDEAFGWGNRTVHPIDIHEVSGGHFTMLRPENVGAIAEILDRSIPVGLARASSAAPKPES